MKERYAKRRSFILEKLGGQCAVCGASHSLEADHIDSATKSFEMTYIASVSEARFLNEVSKCQLLCQACHRTKTLIDKGQVSAKNQHGTLSSYRYCKCKKCKNAKSEYMKMYHKNVRLAQRK